MLPLLQELVGIEVLSCSESGGTLQTLFSLSGAGNLKDAANSFDIFQ